MADLTTSMDHQVMLHQVATIPSLPTVPTTVFRRTRSKLTSRWTSVPPQTSLEKIGSSKLLSRGRKWIKSPSASKLQADAKPNSDFNSRGSEIRLHHKGSTRLVIRRCHRTSTSKPLFKARFLLQRVNSSKPMEWKRNQSVSKLRLCSYNRCLRIRCRCLSQERKQGNQNLVIPVVNNSIKHVVKSSRNARAVNGLSSALSETEQLQAEDSNRQYYHSLLHQSPGWSDTRSLSSVRTTLETMPQEESELDWRAYSRILQCKSRPPQSSFRYESQIIDQSNQELQLATEEESVQSHPTSIRSNTDGSVRISPQPSNEQLLNNKNECTPPRLESIEAMSSLPTTHSFAFYPGEDELIQFEEGFHNTDLPNLEISNLVSDDSSSSSSSSSSHVSSSTESICNPRNVID
ncbi:hypothetical protein DDB_G0267184 [Dictyostelium discoideum AX4]|uniref:Uncharacterized protein n=1 Tax=Dictyostelium discoideum TaxID=44689 RepID=Q55H61_DICDI|nr:hypothetical protein DDB_G0267184 [Dictyostelium discoideum AX4]EAL73829.1 hypothetical protein DDB_G0267184 [Dictyostelium discoideum AX4]|eukprot:XP_647753.1 hypothetical protein DDB_G0267184 [Dictyostelium discoideum AX4]